MSALAKCLMVVVAIFCFMQFVEMARVARDDSKPLEAEMQEWQKISNTLLEKFKTTFDDDTVNSIKAALQKTFESGVDLTKKKFEGIAEDVKNMNKAA